MQELINRYLTADKHHFRVMTKNDILKSKEDLYLLLKWWLKLSKKNTNGNIDNIRNNQKLILIQIGAKSYYVNADTTRAGVEEFLKNKDRNWKIIKSNRGNLNKITNSDKEIPGFYIYKVIN